MRYRKSAPAQTLCRGQQGSVLVETAALGGLVLLVVLVVVQAALAGFASLVAAHAARAGARAQAVGGDVVGAVEAEVPASWTDDLTVTEANAAVEVSIGVPALVPGADAFAVTGFAAIPGETSASDEAGR